MGVKDFLERLFTKNITNKYSYKAILTKLNKNEKYIITLPGASPKEIARFKEHWEILKERDEGGFLITNKKVVARKLKFLHFGKKNENVITIEYTEEALNTALKSLKKKGDEKDDTKS